MEEKKYNSQKNNMEQIKKELKEELKKEVLEELKEENKKRQYKRNEENVNFEERAKETFDKIMDTNDTSNEYEKKDIDENKGMAIISYFGPLSLIPFLTAKESKFVQFHAKQGLNLFIIELIISVFSSFITSILQMPKLCTLWGGTSYECGMITPWWILVPIKLLETLTFVISIIGVIYSYQGKAKELPIVDKVKIIK